MKKFLAVLAVFFCAASLIPAVTAAADTNVDAVMNAADTNVDLEEADGRLEITEAGTYVLTGAMKGTVYVNPGEGDVELILDGADIDGSVSAGIIAVSGNSLTITMPEGSVNRVSDGGADQKYTAAICSLIPTVFEGTGTLYVNGSNQQGIVTENADLTFNGGNYSVKAVTYGIAIPAGKTGRLTINDGYFRIQAGSGSIDPATAAFINGGTIEEVSDSGSGAGTETVPTDTEYAFTEENTAESGNSNAESGTAAESGSSSAEGSTAAEYGSSNAESSTAAESGSSNTENRTEAADIAKTAEKSVSVTDSSNNSESEFPAQPSGMSQPAGNGQFTGQPAGEQPYGQEWYTESAESPSEIVEGQTANSAADLEADLENASYLTITDDDSQVKITSSGTYVVSGSSTDGNITVKKGTTGVVLVLEDLDLTSTTGAAVSVNKEAEVKIIISGEVVLTDAENPEDETSEDAEAADAFDGAALKTKAGSQVCVTGDGTLTINGNAKNGIKAGDDSSLIFDGVTVNISAVNDGINANYDVSLLSGSFTIAAGDDAIHADHILTVGREDGTGPVIHVTESNEGLEGTVVNVYGGDISVVSADDAINAANGDGLYEGELDYSFNMMGGRIMINSSGDGIDSNGNINLIDGSMSVNSAQNGGEAGIDYDGQLYISDDFELNNRSGMAGPDGMAGNMPEGMPDRFEEMNWQNGGMSNQFGDANWQESGTDNQHEEDNGRPGGVPGQPGGMGGW